MYWRIGDDCCATLGTGFTLKQVLLLHNRFDLVYILFDKGVESQEKAKLLGKQLDSMGTKAIIISTDYNEPDDMDNSDVLYLKKELGFLW